MYRPRCPQNNTLRRILVHSLTQTRAELEASDVYLPRFVWRELESILGCGVIERGFVRVVCADCKHERLVGFSCKGRAVCSSCVGRKMNELSLHLIDHVVPDVPLRQFVLTLPFALRLLVARDKRLLAAVRTVFLRAVSGFIRKKTREVSASKTLLTAGLCVVQRFGSALQLAPHFHAALFDGAYRKDDDGKLHFVAAPALTQAERLSLTKRIASRMERLLARRGLFLDGQWTEQDDAGLQLSMEAMKVPAAQAADPTVSNASNVRGYNLHAQTRVSAHDEAARLRLFRYILRPAIAQDRLHFDNELVTFTMKRVFSDGSQVLRFTPQAFIRRIAMLVPAPRQHEITYFGLLAANAGSPGAQGATGAQRATGAQGAMGAQGPPGQDGASNPSSVVAGAGISVSGNQVSIASLQPGPLTFFYDSSVATPHLVLHEAGGFDDYARLTFQNENSAGSYFSLAASPTMNRASARFNLFYDDTPIGYSPTPATQRDIVSVTGDGDMTIVGAVSAGTSISAGSSMSTPTISVTTWASLPITYVSSAVSVGTTATASCGGKKIALGGGCFCSDGTLTPIACLGGFVISGGLPAGYRCDPVPSGGGSTAQAQVTCLRNVP